jgi:hypothetical protein
MNRLQQEAWRAGMATPETYDIHWYAEEKLLDSF